MSKNTTITQCTNCNGDLTFNPAGQTLDCLFCKTTYNLKGEIINTLATVNEAPKLIIPFAFNKEVFEKSAIEWISQGEFTPGDILDSFHYSTIKGIYIPVYLWQISYIITSPSGNKTGGTFASNIAEGQKAWPVLINLAQSLNTSKSLLKPFDKIYTLGFEIADDEITDIDDFNSKARKFAIETVVTKNHLSDGKNVVITEMILTRAYAPFWTNRYNYQGQNYDVVMSGFDVSKIEGTRPVDNKAIKAKKPSFKPAFLTLLACLFIISICPSFAHNKSSFIQHALDAITFICTLGTILVFPVLLILTVIRRASWTSPNVRLRKERELKLNQRLAQRF